MSKFIFSAITNAQDIKNIQSEIELNDQNNVFVSAYWFQNFIDDNYITYTATDENGKIQCALNICVHSKLGFKIAEIAGEPYTQYNDVVNNSDSSVDEFFAQALDHLKTQSVDALHLRNVRADAHIHNYCQKHGTILANKKAPWIDLSQYENYEAFFNSTSKTTRKVYRKLYRNFENIENNIYVDEQITPELIKEVLALKASQLSSYGLSSRVFVDPQNIAELVEAFANPSPDLKTIIGTIRIDGALISAAISHAKADVFYGYIIAMDVKFTSFSPGNAQVIANVEWAMQQGITVFDFLAPSDDYKFKWSKDNYTAAYDFLMPMSSKGRLYGSVYLQFLRPKLKKAYLALRNSSLYKTLKK
ncbi:MAG: GNAT family N-acetyltransferase [Hyphomicrobiales bacterium]